VMRVIRWRNSEIGGHWQLVDLVWLWFRKPNCGRDGQE